MEPSHGVRTALGNNFDGPVGQVLHRAQDPMVFGRINRKVPVPNALDVSLDYKSSRYRVFQCYPTPLLVSAAATMNQDCSMAAIACKDSLPKGYLIKGISSTTCPRQCDSRRALSALVRRRFPSRRGLCAPLYLGGDRGTFPSHIGSSVEFVRRNRHNH